MSNDIKLKLAEVLGHLIEGGAITPNANSSLTGMFSLDSLALDGGEDKDPLVVCNAENAEMMYSTISFETLTSDFELVIDPVADENRKLKRENELLKRELELSKKKPIKRRHLNVEEVTEIVDSLNGADVISDKLMSNLGKEYKVTPKTIQNILEGKHHLQKKGLVYLVKAGVEQ